MLLRHFAVDPSAKEPQVHVFDKRNERTFPTAISNIAAERSFYDLKDDEGSVSIEPALTQLEGHTNTAFEKIRATGRLDSLTGTDGAWVATFVAAQRIRVRAFREAMRQLHLDMKTQVERLGFDREKMERGIESEEDAKIATVATLFHNVALVAPLIIQMDWLLFTTTPDAPFWISDNPLTMHNSESHPIYRNTGFASPGVEIYLPISPMIMLGFWCPSRRELIHAGVASGRRVLKFEEIAARGRDTLGLAIERAHTLHDVQTRLARLVPLLEALEREGTIQCSPDNVNFFNASQVRWAERFVISPRPEFAVANEMVTKYPGTKECGPRMVFD